MGWVGYNKNIAKDWLVSKQNTTVQVVSSFKEEQANLRLPRLIRGCAPGLTASRVRGTEVAGWLSRAEAPGWSTLIGCSPGPTR
jgi:hypothetical protein